MKRDNMTNTTNMMDQGSIIIENDTVTVRFGTDGSVWLTQSEIARLFGVFVSAVSANIRAIYKSGALREDETRWCMDTSPGCSIIVYNLEMIAALAFRLRSHQTQVFRRWLLRRLQSRTVVVRLTDIGRNLPN